MPEMFTLELPSDDASGDMTSIGEEIRSLQGVDDAGSLDARGLDPATIGVWIQLGTSAVGAIASVVSVLEKIKGILKRRGIKRAKLRFNGGEVDLEELSVADLERILGAIGPASETTG